MNKETRRFLRRTANRKGIGIVNCMEEYYKEEFNKNQIFSFYKKRRKGYGKKFHLSEKDKKERFESKIKMLDLIRKTFIIGK